MKCTVQWWGVEGPCSSQVEERSSHVYWTLWILWPSMSDPWVYKCLADTSAQSSYKKSEPICIFRVTMASSSWLCWRLKWAWLGMSGKSTLLWWPQRPVYPWHRLPQETTFQGPKRVPVGFWCLCLAPAETPRSWSVNSRAKGRSAGTAYLLIAPCYGWWSLDMLRGSGVLTVDSCGVIEVMPPPSAAVLYMLGFNNSWNQRQPNGGTTGIVNVFPSMPLAAECRPQFAFVWRGVRYTWNLLPQGPAGGVGWGMWGVMGWESICVIFSCRLSCRYKPWQACIQDSLANSANLCLISKLSY